MFGSYWYIEGADGRHYCYSKEASYRCPIGAGGEPPKDGSGLTAAERESRIQRAAVVVGVSKEFLMRKLGHSGHRARVDGRLTEHCEACGHRLERLGFRYWIESDKPQEGLSETTRRLNRAMGGSGFTMVEGPWYADTKKDAQAWAQMRVKQTKEAT
jgi:hypothetical protein